jgi:YbbR domain-containing protein
MAKLKLSQGVPRSIYTQIKSWFSKNVLLKISALALAVFLWFHSATNRVHQQEYRVPIHVNVTDTSLVDVARDHGNARVLLEGQGKEFLKLLLRKPSVQFAVTDRKPARAEFPLSPHDVIIPEGVDLRSVAVLEPRAVEVELDYLIRRVVPVSPVVELAGEGFVQGSQIVVEPPEILVTGSKRELKGLQAVPTMSVTLPSASGEYEVEAQLDLSGFLTLTTSVKSVRITGAIERVIERKLQNIPVEVIGKMGSDYRAKPETIDLIVTGIESRVASLSPREVKAALEVNSPPFGETYFSPRITLPENVELISEQPKLFRAVPRDSLSQQAAP